MCLKPERFEGQSDRKGGRKLMLMLFCFEGSTEGPDGCQWAAVHSRSSLAPFDMATNLSHPKTFSPTHKLET